MMAIIVELNGSCNRYGITEKDIHEFITDRGFLPVSYNPFERSLAIKPSFNHNGNTIYIKNETEIGKRLSGARKFRILSQSI
jgi:hypothetical protein